MCIFVSLSLANCLSDNGEMMRKNRFFDMPNIKHTFVDAIDAAIVACLREEIVAADPNWCHLRIAFDENPVPTGDRQLTGRVDPIRVWINGPRNGDVLINPTVVREHMHASLIATARVWCDHLRWPGILNPRHEPKIVVGRTMFHFEHQDEAVVTSYDGCYIHLDSLQWNTQVYDYDMRRLVDELAIDSMTTQSFGEVVSVDYLPRLHKHDDGRFESVEQLLAHYEEQSRLADERIATEIERLETREASQPRPALSPELRAMIEAERAILDEHPELIGRDVELEADHGKS